MIIMIILMFGFRPSSLDFLIIPSSSNRMINFKVIFQIGFKNGGYSLVPYLKSFTLNWSKFMIISKSMLGNWSLHLVLKLFSLPQDFKFYGFCVGTLFKHKWFKNLFPHIWQGNSKSSGGQTLFLPLFNNFLFSKIGL